MGGKVSATSRPQFGFHVREWSCPADDAEPERAGNTKARTFTRASFQNLGYRVLPSEINFVLVELGRPAKEFREAGGDVYRPA